MARRRKQAPRPPLNCGADALLAEWGMGQPSHPTPHEPIVRRERPTSRISPGIFEATLVSAMRQQKRRRGAKPDGVLERATWAARPLEQLEGPGLCPEPRP
jgi:murein L,D-transpeptidase YcbB/YkuD